MIITIRTKDDLRTIANNGKTGNWKISPSKEARIKQVRIFSWDMSEVLTGDFDIVNTYRDKNGRLIVGLKNSRIRRNTPKNEWIDIYGSAPFIYSENVDIQVEKGQVTGIIRGDKSATLSKKETTDYFERIQKEIKLRNIEKIVFQGGGTLEIPKFFREWCQINGIEIEILETNLLEEKYSKKKNIELE
jgi:hypothetical protein